MIRRGILTKDFCKKTKDNILGHLDELGANKDVYSTHVKGSVPFLEEKDIYFYATSSEVVVVYLDDSKLRDELADDAYPCDKPPLYFSANDFRVSPVWGLFEAIELMQKQLKAANSWTRVFGVLITSSCIINYDDMEELWKSMNIKVISEVEGLSDYEVKINEDPAHSGKHNVDMMLRSPKAESQLGLFDAPFDKPENSLSSFYEEEEKKPFIDDEIEQNLGLSVQVKIVRPIPNPQEELDKLVGCTEIKQRINELLALTKYNKMMHSIFPDSKQHEVSLHSVFLGRPGTGKTTVCKIFGSLLHEAGALSKGHVVVCDRGTFLGTLWGDEERSMRQVLEKTQGGVLMIDEAYLFNGRHDHDPGRLVIQLMMDILADETQRDIAIVLCGYKEPMEKLLNANPGLQSRFPNRFEFTDFTVDDLLEITRRRVHEYQYEFTQQAWDKYCQVISQAYQQRNTQTWGNARFVANQLERIYIQHASRCVRQRPADNLLLRQLTSEDILPIEVPKERRSIGF